MRYSGALSQPHASVSWWAIHSAVGCAVAPSHKIRRRSWRKMSKPYRSRNEIVGTTKRSIAAIPVGMVAQKGRPALGRRSPPPRHVLGYTRLPDIDAELEQFAVDPRCTP